MNARQTRQSVQAKWRARTGRLAMRILQAVGAGQYRSIMRQGNKYARAQFTTWMAPFRDLGMTVVSKHSLGSTDPKNAAIMASFACWLLCVKRRGER